MLTPAYVSGRYWAPAYTIYGNKENVPPTPRFRERIFAERTRGTNDLMSMQLPTVSLQKRSLRLSLQSTSSSPLDNHRTDAK